MTLDETFKAAKAGDLTNDTTYKVGEISRKTGLQKQPDGSWAPPKKTNYGKVTTNKNGEVGIQQTLGKGSKFEKFGSEQEAARALGNYTAGYNTTERSKEDPHSNEALLHKHWNKETEQIRKENKQADMKKEVLEYLSHTMARENAEAFLDKASPKMLRTMYNNLKYKIPGENKKLHEAEPAASSKKDYTQKAPGPMQNAVSYLNNKTENSADIDEFLDNNGFYSTSNERQIKMADGTMYEIDFKNDDGEKVTRRLMKYDGDPDRQNTKLIYKSSDHGDTPAASSEGESSPGSVKINNDSVEVNGVKIPKDKIRVGGINPEVPVGVMTIESGPDKGSRIMGSYSIKEARRHYQKQGARFTVRREEWGAAEIYETVEGDEAGETWFFNTYKDQLAEAAKGATSDAAYTAESVNAPRENLERKLTGDCKIRIRK